MMLNTRGLLSLLIASTASVMAYPIKQDTVPKVANSWLNSEVQQLSRGSLVAGRRIPGTVATAPDVKTSGSLSPFAAMNAGLDPVSSDCLCLKPGNPALDGRGALRAGGAATLSRAQATAPDGLGMAADRTSGLVAAKDAQPELRAASEELAHAASRNGGSWGWTDERSGLSLQSAPGTSGSELFSAGDQSARGGFGFGGGIGGGGGVFGGGSGTVNPGSGGFGGGTDQLEPEALAISSELALGVYGNAGSPDTGSFTVLAAGVTGPEQRLLALNLGSVKEHELLENSVRFYTAMARGASSSVDTAGRDGIDDSGTLFGWRTAVEKDNGSQGAMRGHDGGGAADSPSGSAPSFSWYTSGGDSGRQEISDRTFAGAEPEVARRITTALSTVSEGFDDSHAAALRTATAVDPVTELQTAVTGVDVMVSSSAPRLDGVVDTSREAPMPLTTAQVPEPSTFVMAAIAAALVLFGAFGARKAS